MADIHGVRVLLCDPDGPKLSSDRDAVDLVGEALSERAGLVVVPVERLGEGFLDLSTRIAGEVFHRFVLYGLRVVVLGDIFDALAASSALRDFVYETNRGRQVWFVADREELEKRLSDLQAVAVEDARGPGCG